MSTNKTITVVGVLVGLGAIGFGVYYAIRKQIGLAFNYCYKIKSFRFNKLSKENIDITLNILLKNQSAFSVELEKYVFNIYINNKYIAQVKSDNKQLIASKGVSPFIINITFNPQQKFTVEDVSKLLVYALTDREKFRVKLDGFVSVNHAGFIRVKELPISIEYSLKELLEDDGTEETCKIE